MIALKQGSYPWQMRVVLAYLRDECGLKFDAAWSRALMALPRPAPDTSEWRERVAWGDILQSHKEAWRAGYERLPAPELDQMQAIRDLADLSEEADSIGRDGRRPGLLAA